MREREKEREREQERERERKREIDGEGGREKKRVCEAVRWIRLHDLCLKQAQKIKYRHTHTRCKYNLHKITATKTLASTKD